MKFLRPLLTLALAGTLVCSTAAFADAIVGAGTANIGGVVAGTSLGLYFGYSSNPPPGDQTARTSLPALGVFSGLTAGETVMIQNLLAPTVIPGTPFDLKDWVQFPDGIDLDLTNIPVPTGYSVCPTTGSSPSGFQCIPNVGSPVVITQGIGGTGARLSLFGDAHYATSTALTPFIGFLTSPSTNYPTVQQFEMAFLATGGIPAVAYSASFTTTPSTVPEPASLALIGIGLLGISLWGRKKFAK